MSLRRSAIPVALVLMAVSLISTAPIQGTAFAQERGMSVTATAERGADIITVAGQTGSTDKDITFRITSPSGNNVVAIGQVSPDSDGSFSMEFKIGPKWVESGFYEITALQGSGKSLLYDIDVFVEVVNGMARETSSTESSLRTGIFETNEVNVAVDEDLKLYPIVIENGSTMFEIMGTTGKVNSDITVTVTAPNGNVITVDQISPMINGEFAAEITVGGNLWKQDGMYEVKVQQLDDPRYAASAQVDIRDGVVVPEFGTIAVMVLVVAIISIVAVSARSRLSIIPRY